MFIRITHDEPMPDGQRHSAMPPVGPCILPFSSKSRFPDQWCILAQPNRRREAFGNACPSAARVLLPFMLPKPSDTLLEHLPLVERIVANVCRGRGMKSGEAEEFAAFVKLRLVENDYAIIRAFRERSSFGTYMTTVVSRLLNDHRNHQWGKWHDSAEAKRLGDLAIELERCVVRDSRTLDEAYNVLRQKYPDITRATLEEIAARFPHRHRRKMVSLEDHPGADASTEPDDSIASAELAGCISRVVNTFVRGLEREDQRLIQLRFGCDMPVPQIAKVLRQDAQALYRKLRTHMAGLRGALEEAGIAAHDVSRLIGRDEAIFDFRLKSGGVRPSNEAGTAPEEDV
jgi:RNA polymerase sigma factor (sigma-70 family)